MLPAHIVMDDGKGNVSTNRALVGEFMETMNAKIDSNQSVLAVMKMKCQLVKDHPLYDLLVDNNSVAYVTLMIEFILK